MKALYLITCPLADRSGLLSARAVQISGLVDSVALILLDKLLLESGIGKPGWGSATSFLLCIRARL
jgi:hypothetical protein